MASRVRRARGSFDAGYPFAGTGLANQSGGGGMPMFRKFRSQPVSTLARLCSSERGYSIIEIIVTMTIFAIIAKIALPEFDNRRLQVTQAQRLLIANLRTARCNAISKSVHYQVAFPSTTQISMSRMLENPAGSGTWVVDTNNVQTTKMPKVTNLPTALVGTTVEFNTRGLAINLTEPQQIDAQDIFGMTKSLQVWPSGQVNEL